MTMHELDNLQNPVKDVLDHAGQDGVILGVEGEPSYAVLPLDDDVLDFLIERNPRFIEECRQLREQMRAGKGVSHEDVKRMFSLKGDS
jgi:hypothetical protein